MYKHYTAAWTLYSYVCAYTNARTHIYMHIRATDRHTRIHIRIHFRIQYQTCNFFRSFNRYLIIQLLCKFSKRILFLPSTVPLTNPSHVYVMHAYTRVCMYACIFYGCILYTHVNIRLKSNLLLAIIQYDIVRHWTELSISFSLNVKSKK